jgi:hypothetical protein
MPRSAVSYLEWLHLDPATKECQSAKLTKKLKEINEAMTMRRRTDKELTKWMRDIRCLLDSVEYDSASKVLDWYSTVVGGKFIPVILCGKSFLDKYDKLVASMDRRSVCGFVESDTIDFDSMQEVMAVSRRG